MSGGAPSDTSRRNSLAFAHTSALSLPTMNGRSPITSTPSALTARLARCHCSSASHCRYSCSRMGRCSSASATASASARCSRSPSGQCCQLHWSWRSRRATYSARSFTHTWLATKVAQRLGPRRAPAPLALVGTARRLAEHPPLERPHGREIDPAETAKPRELGLPVGAEHVVDGRCVQIRDVLDREVDGVEAERRARAVRARLSRRQLVGRGGFARAAGRP